MANVLSHRVKESENKFRQPPVLYPGSLYVVLLTNKQTNECRCRRNLLGGGYTGGDSLVLVKHFRFLNELACFVLVFGGKTHKWTGFEVH